MRIHRVTMKGFGPYKDEQTVNFDEFNDDGLFVITGKTGAGKSSILDAITFALFGDVPRYGSVTDDSVRSKYLAGTAEETRVDLEFSQGNTRYRISRTPSFTKLGNKNPTAAWAELVEVNADGTEEALESRKVGEVNKRVAAIVRLNAAQFKQVILLAQGAFQEFLLAKSEQRRTLLRQLFDSGRYLDYSDNLENQARELKNELAHIATEVRTQTSNLADKLSEPVPEHFDGTQGSAIIAWAQPLVATHGERLAAVTKTATEAKTARAEAEKAFNKAKDTAQKQQRLREAQELQVSLAEREPAIGRDRLVLDAAKKADLVWLAVEAEHAAKHAVEAAIVDHAQAKRAFEQLHPGADQTVPVLKDQAQELASDITRLKELLGVEVGLVALARAHDEAALSVDRAKAAQDAATEKLALLQESEPELKDGLSTARKVAEDLTAATQVVTALEAQLKAASKAELIAGKLKTARDAEIAEREKSVLTSSTLTALKKQQYAQFAGVLAKDLAEGGPCAVCGSLTHPHPAVLDDEHVTDEQVEKAELLAQTATERVGEASNFVSELNATLEAAKDASHGELKADIEATLQAANSRLKDAQTAADLVKTLTTQIENLTDRLRVAADDVSETKVRVTQAQNSLKNAAKELEQDAAKIETARGDFESVNARLEHAHAQHEAVESLLNAASALVQVQSALDAAKSKSEATLKKHGFTNTADVKSARVAQPEQERLEQHVRDFDRTLAIVTNTLAEDALQNLPIEPVELQGLEETYEVAREREGEALTELGSVTSVHNDIERLLGDIETAFEHSGSAQQEYETVDRLAQTVRGIGPNTKKMSLETFALAADLEEIVAAANVLLHKMTSGRYELRYSDERLKNRGQSGLGLEVIDAYNDEKRPPESLSGGEKFQASLALALGLADVVTSRNGGVKLDTLFIDEGFGALDDDTLSEVLDTIDGLREHGRTVGLISHVDKVKERIPNHINVQVAPGGWSTIAG